MASSQLIFSSRIVSVDSYMTEPVAGLDLEKSDFHKTAIHSVPVVRVFGSTPAGQTTCLHIHGVFPYLMVPYNGPDVTESHWSEIDVYTHVLAAGLDNALNAASGKSKSARQHVFKIVLLRGIPFYGYHEDEELFLKIYFYFPGDVKRAADLLQNGAVLDRSFQVHEAHIPYILQLFLDYNLYGMNLLHARNCWFRMPIGKPDMISELPVIQRPDDIAPNADKTVNKKAFDCQLKDEKDKGGDYRAPTTSQLRNFDWNTLRDANLRQGSQNAELDPEEEYVNLSGNKSEIVRANENADDSLPSVRGDSCSDMCSTVLSRTVTQDSTLLNSPGHKLCPLHTLWTSDVVPGSAKLPGSVSRHSTCDIEVDVLAADIANRYELLEATTSNPGIEAIWEDEKSRRRKRDEDSQIVMEQSQPRAMPENLSEREARYFQMLYDALDRYKEENGGQSFSESLSFTTPSTGSKRSPESLQSRRESVDFFASPSDVVSDDSLVLSGGSTLPAGSQGMKSSGSSRLKWSQSNSASMMSEDDISTLELLRRMEERDALDTSVATQHGNGPLDADHERLDVEECEQSHNRTMKRLSQSFRDSPRIESFSDDTRPLPSPSDDEDAIESFEMSQRWDSAIRDLLDDMSASEIREFTDSEDDSVPQLDGTSDDLPKSTSVIASETDKRVSAIPTKQHLSSKAPTIEADSINGDDVVGDEKQGSHRRCTRRSRTNSARNNAASADTKSCTENVADCKKLEDDTQCNISSQNTSFDTLLKDEIAKSNETSANETIKIAKCKDENLLSTEIIKPTLKQAIHVDKPDVVLTKRQGGARTNVFKQILNENPGVTLYDNDRLCKFTRTAVINLDQMPAPDARRTYPISTLDGNMIKITSVPVAGLNTESESRGDVAAATKPRRVRKKTDDVAQKEACQQTRARRPRLASKNSYLEDPLYETTFDSDFESDCDDPNAVALRSSVPRLNGTKTKSKKAKEPKKRKKRRAVTKWIIVNRFKGVSSMRVGLWRIPNAKRVKLTAEGLRLYELYSPKSADIVAKPVRPPLVPPPKKPRPMGRRSKHMLASLCPFGPRRSESNAADVVSTDTDAASNAAGGNAEILNSSSKAPDAASPLTQNSNPEPVQSDAPILEKMAFDLLRHGEALSEQVSDSHTRSKVKVDEDQTKICKSVVSTNTVEGVSVEYHGKTELFASLKGSCTGVSNAIVMKQKPSADAETAVVSTGSLTSCVIDNTPAEAEKLVCTSTGNHTLPQIESSVTGTLESDVVLRLEDRVVSSEQAEHSVSALCTSLVDAVCKKGRGGNEVLVNCKSRNKAADKTAKKKAVKLKKEAKKRKLATKIDRNSLSPNDDSREAKVTKSIVPVASRTVQPICKIASVDSDAGNCTIDLVENKDCGAAKSAGSTRADDDDTVIAKRGLDLGQEKKAVSVATPVRRVYSPSKKVTRNSVTVKLNSIHRPRTMFTASSDDSREPFPPPNALMSIAYPPSPVACPKGVAEPPRPWSPVMTQGTEAATQETERDFFGELAESLGADASKMFDLVDDSLFKNMGGLEQLIADHPAEGQKEERPETAPHSTRDKNETMLQHFDKVFEDVTSNGPSKAFRAGASANLDQFEKETLMEFIDEMTSPTQLGDNNPPQTIAYPVPAPTPMNPPQNASAAPKKQAPPKTQVPAARRAKTPFPNAPFVNENWVMPTTHNRPQSCYSGQNLPNVTQVTRPGTVANQWRKDVASPALYNDAHMKEIQNNLSAPKPYGYNAANHCYEPQNKPNCSYFNAPGTPSRCTPPQSSYPYAFNQYYRDPGQIPRPNSVLDTPLQVFHTHVHHHHHVHSINNSEGRGTQGGTVARPYFDPGAVKREAGGCNVKIEKIPNPNWPKATAPAAPKAKCKSKKTQFYVSNSPFPFPKAASQVCVQSQGLVQTLTYVDTAVARDRAGSKSGFYKFTGLDPKSQGIVQSAVAIPRCQRQSTLFSVLLKGTCQTVTPRRGYHVNSAPFECAAKPKNAPKSKNSKKKTKYKPAIPICSNKQADAQLPSAKTPYGIMKQSALNAAKKQDFIPKSAERKRKQICDFDAPPDTPTISLSGWSSSSGDRKTAESFELSQDMYDSTKASEREKASAPPNSADARPGKSTLSPDPRPTPQPGEELILNSATGEWEVVPAEPHKSDDEGGAVVSGPGNLPGRSPARKRAHGKAPDVSSDDDGADVGAKTKCLKTGRTKIAFSTPEYMVSSVDLKSDSPRLKLTLKKAPAGWGKPQISALPPADRGGSENFGPKTADELKPLKIVRKKSGPAESADTDGAQFRIYDSDSTDDASETDDVIDESFPAGGVALGNRSSVTVTMGESQAIVALATLTCGRGVTKETASAETASSDMSGRFSACVTESQAETGEVALKVLRECCDLVANEATELKPESRRPKLPDRAGGHKSCSGGDTKKAETRNDRKSTAKHVATSNAKDIRMARTTNPNDNAGPPSPPGKQSDTLTSRSIAVEKFYTTSDKPPSPAVVMQDLVSSGQASHLSSDEPFYGNAADAGAPSNRLSNLPPYVKRPKPRKSACDLPEHASSLPIEGGIRHWIVMATAGRNYSESDSCAMRQKAAAILPENVHVWDHLDAASKLSQYPRLSEVFLEGGDVILRPALSPPTWRDVQEWLDSKKKTRTDEEFRTESDLPESSVSNKGGDLPVKTPKPSLRRSLSFTSPTTSTGRPRRVSFDVADVDRIKSRDSERLTLKPIEGSPVKKCDEASNSDVPFSVALSPVGCDSKIGGSPLTSEISDGFLDSRGSSAEDARVHEGSIKKRPQSTPSAGDKRQSKHAHKRLSYASRANPDGRATVSPISEKSPHTPASKKSELRKVLLSKKFSNRGDAGSERSSGSNSLSLSTPSQGSKRGSQVDGPTLDNTYGFKGLQQHLGEAKSLHVVQHVTTVSLELHVKTRIDLRPDPDMDEIRCLFYCLDSDSWTGSEIGMRTGVIAVDPSSSSKNGDATMNAPSTSSAPNFTARERELFKKSGVTSLDVRYVTNETELFLLFAQFMHRWDPDILVGYEVQMLSWGYLLQRAAHLRCDLCRAISRIPSDEQRNRHSADSDVYGADNASELHIVGRVVLNLWRLMRTELALYDYSFESVAFHMLHERHPRYDHRTLTNWFDPPSRSGLENHCHRYRVIDYYVSRVRGNMRLLTQQDFIGRTSELARLFGIQFYEVLTRGSQFRVESMLLRTARARNMVAVTPSVLQRAQMRAPEVIALVMEPESRFYRVPVVVVDFQSLYPSVVIAHNICYSTCLGRVESLGSDAVFTFGCTSLRIPAKTLRKLLRKNLISINPSGVAFVKPKVRKGVMPRMLDEILTTRIMVKDSMKKLGPDAAATKRMLDHRQIGLKYIANFTYGYTAANFSGRMPCVEIGDSIVHKARETLERAVRLVTANSVKWENARVVYGDTDSMFIALEGVNETGCSKARAFEVGREITAAVTADNPTPVKLKFEKVYLPCVLETKKRYVGYAYESEEQKEPIFDAKGIETVRRDGTPATAKILEKTLKILFDTRDVSKVKEYVSSQCTKLLDGRTTLQDCVIAKEYRGKQYYKPGAVVPALNIARKLLALDRRAEPRVGERVPYVIVHGPPATPLYQLVRSPLDVLKDPSLQLNGAYYVTKHVLPALDRVFSLLGVDVFLWYRHLPRTVHLSREAAPQDSQAVTTKKATISQFFQSKHCLACKSLCVGRVCADCLNGDEARQRTVISLASEASALERRKHDIDRVCMHCTGAQSASEIRCVSLDCSTLYKSFRAAYSFSKVKALRKSLRDHDLL